ncbi:MAG: SDR family oxidoreductase [Ferruginibacter sp.]|nr:SDR family oxidoreductase [Cytophagales bacterium]
MPKRILITGANGLLGQKLVDLLTTQPDVDVIATARGKSRLPNAAHYRYESLDVTRPEEVDRLLDEVKPHAVIHTAAMTNVDQCEGEREACWEMNVRAVEHLAAACRRHDRFLLHLSTDFIFDGLNGPYDEEAIALPVSYYGESKLAAERILQRTDSLRWAIARTVLVYGIAHDMSRSNLILWVKKSLEDGKTIQVVNDQWRTPTLAEDLALGCWLIVQQEVPGIFNLSGKDFLTPYEMAIQTAGFFRLDTSLIKLADSSTFTQPAKRPPRTGFTLDKARRVLGYEPRSFGEGIAVLARQMAAK